MDLWKIENGLYEDGWHIICGVDEAGRGPLAGPVYAAAVILPRGLVIDGLNDSKQLSAKKRDALYDIITEKALAWGVGSADEREIDERNILQATYLAMNRAIAALEIPPELALIDGNRSGGIEIANQCIVGGDGLSASIAAASILAKVTRDRLMIELDAKYPGYGFAQHKGYGTKAHYEALDRLGPCPIHRLTFLKKHGLKK
ncbi:MAG: ribonuclease HII [Oscillospiraceae bacterium]|nr:ribonuclease HII [Oscillospiraceae bacterium]